MLSCIGLQVGTGPGLPADTCCLAPGQGAPGRADPVWAAAISQPLCQQEPTLQPVRHRWEFWDPPTPGPARCRVVPAGASSPWGCKAPKAEESCSLPLCCPLSDHAVLAVCKAVYYRHVNNLSQCLITWKGNQSCGSSLKSMPISLALGRDFCFFVFHSHNKYVTTDPASKGNTYL